MHTVVLVDDQPAILKHMSELVNDTGIARVVGVENSGERALAMILRERPDLVMIDVSMPELNGIDVTRALIAEWPQVRVLGVSAHADGIYVRSMMAAGAQGYMLKDHASNEISDAVTTLMSDGKWIGQGVSELLD